MKKRSFFFDLLFKKSNSKYFTISVCLAAILSSMPFTKNYGQTNYTPPAYYTPPTPAASQFEKYINYPVDHNTGAISVNVPLYTLKAGSIEVPISLSYHASGVKPGDPSIPVGLGWVINPGARVTRKVVSYPDELYPKAPYQSNYDAVNDLQALENMEYSPSSFWPSSNRNATKDAESDVFTYYTGTGVQGRFSIKQQGEEYVAVPLVLTNDKIKIHTLAGSGTPIDYIEITDANGTFYRFGKGLSAYSTNPQSVTNEATGPTSNGWTLTDIISADKADTVSLIWQNLRNDYISNWYKKRAITDNLVITDKLAPWVGTTTYSFYTPWGYSDMDLGGPQTAEVSYIMTAIGGLKYKNQEVKMVYTSTIPTTLTSVEIYSSGIKQRQIDFQTSNFDSYYKRLDGISMRDKASQVVSNYSFGYDQTIQLPDEYGRGLDFWGYNNGYSGNQTTVPNFPYYVDRSQPQEGATVYYLNTYSNRTSNDNAQAYILNRVTYPTGGKTTYEYEVNRVADASVIGGSPTGGCRVKKIYHWTSDGQLAETRTYKYGVNECGYGEGTPITADMFVDESQTWVYYVDAHLAGGTRAPFHFTKRFITGSPVNPMFMSDLPPVSYQEITEYIGDNLGNNSGKIVYSYSSAPLPNSTYFQYTHYTYADRYYQKPVLLSTSYFKNTSGNYSLVQKNSTDYIDYEDSTINQWVVRRWAYIMSNDNVNDVRTFEIYFNSYLGGLSSVFQYFPVYLHRGIKVPTTQRNIVYSPTGESVITEKTFGYLNNDYLYPRTVTTTNSNGATAITHLTYPKDYNVGSSPTNSIAQGIKLLQDRNVVAPVIEEYTEVQPGNVIKSGKFTTYKTDTPLPENIYSLNAISSPASFSPAAITSSSHTKSGSYLLKSTVDMYDTYGNIRQITDKTSNITTVVLYSYGGKLPVAILKNTTYANLLSYRTDSGINDFASQYPTDTEVDNFVSTLRSSLPQAYITTYKHDPFLGATSQTDENGRTITYVYDPAGRLQLIKDKDGNVVKTFEYKYKQ